MGYVCLKLTSFTQPGDRVAAFHEIATPGGSYAEYGLAWAYTTFHIPNEVPFEGQYLHLSQSLLTLIGVDKQKLPVSRKYQTARTTLDSNPLTM